MYEADVGAVDCCRHSDSVAEIVCARASNAAVTNGADSYIGSASNLKVIVWFYADSCCGKEVEMIARVMASRSGIEIVKLVVGIVRAAPAPIDVEAVVIAVIAVEHKGVAGLHFIVAGI